MHFKLNVIYLKGWILKNSINQAEKKKKGKNKLAFAIPVSSPHTD